MRLFKYLLIGLFLFSIVGFDVPTSPYSDPPDAQTVLQLSFDEADGSTTTDDESANNFTITANGNVQTDSGVTKFSNTSLFDGTGDYWSIPDDASFSFGTGNWTLDCWVYMVTTWKGGSLFELYTSDTTLMAWYPIGVRTTAFYMVVGGVDKAFGYTDLGAPSADAWHHLAIVRYGTGQNNMYQYLDGTSLNLTWATNLAADYSIPDFTGAVKVGWAVGSGNYMNGNVDEFRVSKGVARDWLPTDQGDVIIIQYVKNFINNLNPSKIGTSGWSCKIKVLCWWKNITWKMKG